MVNIPIQKVLHYEDALKKKTNKILGDYIVSEKLDGNYGYINYVPGKGYSEVLSSSGKVFPGMRGFTSELTEPILSHSFRLIFELYNPELTFYEINGLLKRHERTKDIYLYCHDLVFFSDSKYLYTNALDRFYLMLDMIELMNHSKLRVSHILDVSPEKEVWYKQFDRILGTGGEGIVLKQANSMYLPGKRNETLLKMKENITLDVEVIGIFNSVGKKGNDALNLTVRRKSGITYNVVVPKDSDKHKFRNTPALILGKVAEIKAKNEVENGKLREPRFIRIREDKEIKDID